MRRSEGQGDAQQRVPTMEYMFCRLNGLLTQINGRWRSLSSGTLVAKETKDVGCVRSSPINGMGGGCYPLETYRTVTYLNLPLHMLQTILSVYIR